MLERLMSILGVRTLESKAKRYIELEQEFDVVKTEITELANVSTETKDYLDKAMSSGDEYIRQRAQEKYNTFLTTHLKRVGEVKRRRDKITRELEVLREDQLLNKAVTQLKRESSLEVIKKAYKTGNLPYNKYNDAIKAEQGKVHYSDVIIRRKGDGKFLVLKRANNEEKFAPNKFCLPGGHVDPGENHLTAAKRELMEETYLSGENFRQVAVYDDGKVMIEYYEAETEYADPIPTLESSEHVDYKWVSWDEFEQLDTILNLKENLSKVYAPLKESIITIAKAVREGFLEEEVLAEVIEKARSGYYKNTPENRKKGRVGQKYGSEKRGEEKGWEKLYKQDLRIYGEGVNKDVYKVAGRTKEILSNRGIEARFSVSNTDFGTSAYFYPKKEGDYISNNKIRVSDHSVMNIDRMRNESHYDTDSSPETVANEIERIVKPERFTKIEAGFEYVNGLGNVVPREKLTEDDKFYLQEKEYEGTENGFNLQWGDKDMVDLKKEFLRTSKSGNKIYKYSFDVKYPVKREQRYVTVRKDRAEDLKRRIDKNLSLMQEGKLKDDEGKVIDNRVKAISIAIDEVEKSCESTQLQGTGEDTLNKARGGYYKDTHKNRKEGRVGAKYGSKTFQPNLDNDMDHHTDGGKEESTDFKKVKDYAKQVLSGEKQLERLSSEEERGRITSGRANVEATILVGANERASDESREAGERRPEQERLIESYAKENKLWVDRMPEISPANFIGSGAEAKVYKYGDNKVLKVNNLSQHEEPIEFLDRIAIHNYLFPEARYETVGFTRNDEGDFSVVLKQPFAEYYGEDVTKDEIRSEMERMGFVSDGGNNYKNNDYLVDDLHRGNVIKTKYGLSFIDPVIYLNKDGDGYGGKRELGEINVEKSEDVEAALVLGAGTEIGEEGKELDGEQQGSLNTLKKAFGQGLISKDVLEKAQRVYADNAHNRKLKRAGKPYGSTGQQEDASKDKPSKEGDETGTGSKSVEEHAKEASGKALEEASKNAKDPELRETAHKELDRREKEESGQEDYMDKHIKEEESGKKGVKTYNSKDNFISRYKEKIKNWTEKEKEFFREGLHKAGSEERRNFGKFIKDKAKGIVKATKHEVGEFKEAGVGISKLFKGKKLDVSEKKAIKNVSKHLALTVGSIALTGGTGHLIHAGIAGATKGLFIHYLEHVGVQTLGRALIFASDKTDIGENQEVDAEKVMEQLLLDFSDWVENEDMSDGEWIQIMEDSKEDEGVEKAEKDHIPGGKAEGKGIEDVMKKYNLSKEEAMKICQEGTNHELEHTSDENIAREIARDHIWEDKDYYKKLKKIED